MIQVAILDDNRDFTTSLKRFIDQQAKLACVLTAHTLEDFFSQISAVSPIDILLLDISLEQINSLEHITAIKTQLPKTRIIVMTGHKDPAFLLQALQEGSDSYYLKHSAPGQLIDTIIATYRGGAFLDPQAAVSIVDLFRKEDKKQPLVLLQKKLREAWQLNKRELQIAEGLLEEKTYQEIATANNIALDTVRHYVKSLYRKAGVHNKLELLQKLKDSQDE